MPYTFRSKADADLLMMEPVGDQILRIVGREPSRSGIIEVAAIPAAIGALEAAIAAERMAQRGERRDDDAAEERDRGQRVGLAQRAWPMLAMMKRALAEGADIVWGA